jgi:hypothetical protein
MPSASAKAFSGFTVSAHGNTGNVGFSVAVFLRRTPVAHPLHHFFPSVIEVHCAGDVHAQQRFAS